MDVFRQLKEYYWVERKYLFASIACLICATALGLVYPNMLRVLIDDVIKPRNFGLVPQIALTVVGVVAIKGCMTFLSGYFGGKLGNKVAFRLRNACYSKLQKLSFQYYDTAKTGRARNKPGKLGSGAEAGTTCGTAPTFAAMPAGATAFPASYPTQKAFATRRPRPSGSKRFFIVRRGAASRQQAESASFFAAGQGLSTRVRKPRKIGAGLS